MPTTTHYGWTLPTVGGDTGTWGTILNTAFEAIDGTVFSQLADKLNVVNPTASGRLTVQATDTPTVGMRSSNGPSNEKEWIWQVFNDGSLHLRTVDDAFANPDEVWSVYRAGTTVEYLQFQTAVCGDAPSTTAAGAVSLDCRLGNYFRIQTSGNITLSFTDPPPAPVAYGMVIVVVATGSHTVTWPASVKWPGGQVPVQTPNGTDVYALMTDDGGATWRAVRTARAVQ